MLIYLRIWLQSDAILFAVLVQLLKFVHRFFFIYLKVELILVRRLVAAYQSFLLNSSELFLHLKEPVHIVNLRKVVLKLFKLLSIELIIIILKQVDLLGIR